jgi:argininosuccinate lyase
MSGVPFSEAHEITGALVKACEAKNIELSEASVQLLAEVDPRLTAGVLEHLTLEAAVAARTGQGGTAPARVREQIGRLKQHLTTQAAWTANYRGPRC